MKIQMECIDWKKGVALPLLMKLRQECSKCLLHLSKLVCLMWYPDCWCHTVWLDGVIHYSLDLLLLYTGTKRTNNYFTFFDFFVSESFFGTSNPPPPPKAYDKLIFTVYCLLGVSITMFAQWSLRTVFLMRRTNFNIKEYTEESWPWKQGIWRMEWQLYFILPGFINTECSFFFNLSALVSKDNDHWSI